MIIAKTITELQNAIEANGASQVGLVPTMGALHEGHISLVRRCVSENDICVVSVFVNPTQFNDKGDLERYPRTPEADAALLEQNGCNIVFMPSVEEMYPEPDTRVFELGGVAAVMEGAFRPGHFNGVAQIVSKLFYAVKPTRAYFGEKDFQQIAVIKEMNRQIGGIVEIVPCPIVREESGLAKSSRNTLLTEAQRVKAAKISRVLKESVNFVGVKSVKETIEWVEEQFKDDSEFRMDYYSIVDGDSLQDISDWGDSNYIVGCIAIYLGKIRLIDNIKYKK
ncbi:MAG: pantoate--beta-alanine ligase [Paludibacteraceae bacterium]|nr:pantoate--beta-alanine ligase [Paludibacteraceae bacterium]